jgi:hypothetical protein
MPSPSIDTAALVPASVHVRLKRATHLAAMTQELTGLRFSIILLARWEAARSVEGVRMVELKRELAELRRLYLDKIDEIAMTFGVEEAMKAKEDVERTVVVPREMTPLTIQRHEQVTSEEGGETGYGL